MTYLEKKLRRKLEREMMTVKDCMKLLEGTGLPDDIVAVAMLEAYVELKIIKEDEYLKDALKKVNIFIKRVTREPYVV